MLDNVLFLMPADSILTAPVILGALLREMRSPNPSGHTVDAAFSADAEGDLRAVDSYMADNDLSVLVKFEALDETLASEDITINGQSIRLVKLPSPNSPVWLSSESFQSAVRLLEGALMGVVVLGDPRWN